MQVVKKKLKKIKSSDIILYGKDWANENKSKWLLGNL